MSETAARRPQPLALVGPTASGKSALALALAPDFDAEIVSVDSMTIYRGMDVGTAKPSAEERAAVRHHLLDVADPSERFSVARFQRLARAAIDDIGARGKRPLVVGGSGLYFRAALDPLEFPPYDAAVRARLEALPLADLHAALAERDPHALDVVDPLNHRRVVRALEVIELTGRPFSSFRDGWERYAPAVVAGLRVSPEVLRRRIDERLRAQLAAGFADEVRALLDAGYARSVTAIQAIPYAQGVALVEGRLDEEGFLREAGRANRRLARRQMAWFARDPRVRWFDADDTEHAARGIAAYWRERLAGE